MEDFAKPENYQGSNLLTIKNIAERIRLEKEKGSTLSELRKKEKTYNKSAVKMPTDEPRKSISVPNKEAKAKISDYSRLILKSSKKSLQKRESLLIDIDLLKLGDLVSLSEPNAPLRKTIPTTRLLFGIVYTKKSENDIRKLAIKLFKWAGRMVMIWISYFSLVTEKSQLKQQKYLISVETYKETDDSGNSKSNELQFDKLHFRATKEIDLTADMQKTLTIHPKQRTDEQANCVMYGLAALEAFNEYPVHLKRRICKVAYYKRIEPQRVIIRQSHRAEYFYFIISGKAIVTITNNGTERTVNSLTKGCSFGELALLHHSRRTASVISTSTMQLLAIEREDFFQIFMNIKSDLSKYPEHVAFLKDIYIFNKLDADKLVKFPESCLCHFYKNGSVICTNDRESEWVYVVKSGHCTVIKEIKVPVKEGSFRTNILSLDDIKTKMQCFDNYHFIPTPLDDASGNAKSKTRYLWRQPTDLKPGDYFYLKNEMDDGGKQVMQEKLEKNQNPQKATFSVFIEVAHLTTKDFYGLSSVIFAEEDKLRTEDMASIALISNRAEMVLISKKYLSQNSDEDLIKDIRQGISQYPSDEVFLETYQTKVNWNRYRLQNYQTTIKNHVG